MDKIKNTQSQVEQKKEKDIGCYVSQVRENKKWHHWVLGGQQCKNLIHADEESCSNYQQWQERNNPQYNFRWLAQVHDTTLNLTGNKHLNFAVWHVKNF